ncbi:6930_t:CDS:2 [Ambispora leptoticha]|uniref:6930_t:CDS:1 n=1 Tax=Ambispora leptoticha TaxID=144679 RepID=A0A9N8V4X0_9GLOM|nr:6930_t:CDS:2 [Ambispora leptoticha]
MTMNNCRQSSNKSPNPGNIQYLPNHVEAQQKINEIKTAKDEKIALVNSKCGFPSLKSVPNNQQRKTNFTEYFAVVEPELKARKFKSSFATQTNYQVVGRRIEQTINPRLSSLCSQFSSLSDAKGLSKLINNYLGEILKANIYAELAHDDLAKQLNISSHQKYELQQTGNNTTNTS